MRHRVKTKKLSRNKASREALLRSLMRALILSQSIITTSAKAKEVKKFAERLISVAKKSSVNSHRRVFQRLADKKVVKKFFSEIVPQLEDKTGGNIRLIKTGKRKGDGADMSLIEFILVEKKEEKKGKKKERMPRIRRKKPPKEKKKEEKTKKSEKK
ncbi:MAG: 50S ribosomal protein L17 [Candidatus Cloacimonadota bacterium]|nr:MAG: 50S ribosomal protein L17 [Candidatus Cloacimonadota bacterium]